jgi:prepilin-type N-terminal cleavage/methylation domain-containing protein
MMRRRSAADRQAGFTLIELSMAMVILGILLAMAGPTWQKYQGNQERVSASQEVVSVLRAAQVRATAEEATYRVDVDSASRSLKTYRFDGAGYQLRSTSTLEGSSLSLSGAFKDKAGATTASAYFYPRGTASPGQAEVARAGHVRKHVITVEGLTGRVSST